MRWNLINILISVLCSMKIIFATNITENSIPSLINQITESPTFTTNNDKTTIEKTDDLIKQIMSAKTTTETTTTSFLTTPKTTIKAATEENKIKNNEESENKNNILDKIQIEGVTIEEIMKRCKEIQQQNNNVLQPTSNVNNIKNQPFSNQDIQHYLSSLQNVHKDIPSKMPNEYQSVYKQEDYTNQVFQNIKLPQYYRYLIDKYYRGFIQNSNVNRSASFSTSNTEYVPDNKNDQTLNQMLSQQQTTFNTMPQQQTTFNTMPQQQTTFNTMPQQQTTFNTMPQQQTTNSIQLVPTVLQKITLKNGQVVYYIPRKPHSYSPIQSNPKEIFQDHQVQASNQAQNIKIKKENEKVNALNTIKTSSSSNTLPKYEVNYNNPTQNDSENITNTPDLPNYNHQLRFVMPFKGCKDEIPTLYPTQADPYAYLTKSMQPSEVNVRVPYIPTYYALKSLIIPDNLANVELNNDEQK